MGVDSLIGCSSLLDLFSIVFVGLPDIFGFGYLLLTVNWLLVVIYIQLYMWIGFTGCIFYFGEEMCTFGIT
jgi:hypothetical protein